MRLASKGASQAAIAGGAIDWLIEFTKEHATDIDEAVIEAEVRKRQSWKSSTDADDITRGLIFLTRGVLFKRGIYRITMAPVKHRAQVLPWRRRHRAR